MTRKPFTAGELLIVLALMLQITGILVILALVKIPPENNALFASVSAGGVVATFLLWGNYRFGNSGNADNKDAQVQMMLGHMMEMAKGQASPMPLPPPAPEPRVIYVQAPAPAAAPAADDLEIPPTPPEAPPAPPEPAQGTLFDSLHKSKPPAGGGAQ